MPGDSKAKRRNHYIGCRFPTGTLYVEVNGKELRPDASQRVWNHSPDGFEWGYCGSGPAQLALALLLHEYGDRWLALDLYQEFKADVVAKWSQARGTAWILTSDQLDAWVATHPRTPEDPTLVV